MRRRFGVVTIIGFLVFVFSSCSKSTPHTSLGTLVGVETRQQVATKGETISAKAQELLYLLTFEGQKEIRYEQLTPESYYPLVDSAGQKFRAVFVGSFNKEGVLSQEGWDYSPGTIKPKDGGYVLESQVKLPEPKVVFVYAVPAKSRGLLLIDGEQRHQLP